MTKQLPPHVPAFERLRRIGISAWAIIGVLLLAAFGVWLLLRIRIIVPPLVLALLIIYLLNPPITRLARRGVPRAVAAITVFVLAIAALVGIGIAVVPFLSSQVEDFSQDWPRFRSELISTAQETSRGVEDRFGFHIDTSAVPCWLGESQQLDGEDCRQVTDTLRQVITGQTERITAIGVSVLEGVLVFILSPLLALYLLIDLPQLQRDFLNLVPEPDREEAADLGSKLGAAVGGFFRGQLLVAFLVGTLSALGFWIIGLPFWLVIGAVAGFFNLVPFVGPFIGGAVGFFVGTISGGVALGIKAAIVEVIVQQIDNHFLSPIVMRRAVQLHPATIMLALLAGGTLAGFWGVLLAVPTLAGAKILLSHFWATRVLGAQVSPYASVRTPRAPSPAEPEEASPKPEAEPETAPRS